MFSAHAVVYFLIVCEHLEFMVLRRNKVIVCEVLYCFLLKNINVNIYNYTNADYTNFLSCFE